MRKSRHALVLISLVGAFMLGLPGTISWAAPNIAAAGGSTYPLAGTNVPRGTDQLVVYSRTAAQMVSPANQWGAEAIVQASVVMEIRDRQNTGQAGTPIPSAGTVLSGHGAARLWMLTYLRVGAPVTYPGSGAITIPTPTPTASPTASPPPTSGAGASATISGAVHLLNGVNIPRDTDALIAYTNAAGASAPTNQWGAEAAVLAGQITQIRDQQSTGAPAMPIPTGGFVLSGHGASRLWLLAQAGIGVPASYTTSGSPPPSTPPTAPPSPASSPAPSATSAPPINRSCAGGYLRLTFDDGPDATVTPQVLDTLKSRGVRATFFVVGVNVAAQPGLVRREAAEGHQVGNHTWDHPYLTQLSVNDQTAEFTRDTDAIIAAGAPRPTQWRPPYEDWNSGVQALASSLGMTMVLWSYETDSNDWQGGSPEVIRDRILTNAHDGDTVLMHDRIQNSATALPMILDGLVTKNMCIR